MNQAEVTDHAIVRHLQRKLGFTRDELANMVADERTREWAYFVKKGKFVRHNSVYIVRNRKIVTTYLLGDTTDV